MPSSPAGDYFDVTRFISYSVAGDININGNDYTRQDDIHYSPSVYPDPNLPNTTGRLFTIQESIAGPISIHTKGSWQVTLDPSDCCLQNGPNVYLFEQVLQIERFHPDGTLDPLSTPEPTSCALMGSGLLCGFGFLRLRKARRN
ncbi:MAG: PEP-CTERM sorting domain-containing protein [Acidobacteriaceae bacterium]|nr:PEP-CTERM sorting domain-containing protein [Acidobacteriaceae bacterium]